MTDQLQPLSPLESALADVEAADRAGVFARTRIDTRALMRESTRPSLVLTWIHRATAIAALLAVVVGLWAWQGSDSPTPKTLLLASASPCDGSFFGCVTGPRQVPGTPCADFDYDADGDVDMLDFSAFQRRCDGLTR